MGEHDLLTTKEVAEHLRLVEKTIRKMIYRGELKAVKLGKTWRIRREDVEKLLSDKRKTNNEKSDA